MGGAEEAREGPVDADDCEARVSIASGVRDCEVHCRDAPGFFADYLEALGSDANGEASVLTFL
eukprot:3650826-Pyramimonas_sp.AAC.1